MAVIRIEQDDFFHEWRDRINEIGDFTGDPDNLSTVNKNTLVEAINEVFAAGSGQQGILTDLHTNNQTTLVEAINELHGEIGGHPDLGVDTLTTTGQTFYEAVNELDGEIGDVDIQLANPSWGSITEAIGGQSLSNNDAFELGLTNGIGNTELPLGEATLTGAVDAVNTRLTDELAITNQAVVDLETDLTGQIGDLNDINQTPTPTTLVEAINNNIPIWGTPTIDVIQLTSVPGEPDFKGYKLTWWIRDREGNAIPGMRPFILIWTRDEDYHDLYGAGQFPHAGTGAPDPYLGNQGASGMGLYFAEAGGQPVGNAGGNGDWSWPHTNPMNYLVADRNYLFSRKTVFPLGDRDTTNNQSTYMVFTNGAGNIQTTASINYDVGPTPITFYSRLFLPDGSYFDHDITFT